MFSRRIAIDLGTAYSVVAQQKNENFWRIASSIAYDLESDRAVAFGEEAKKMFGRCPERYRVIRPLQDGVIADFEATNQYVNHLVNESSKKVFAFQYQIFLCVPWGATAVELRSYQQSLKAGRRKIFLVREPFAAAIGCGHNVQSNEPITLVDMGGGTTEIATVAGGFMVHATSLRSGGAVCDQMISEALRSTHQLDIGLSSAESLKMQCGSVWPTDDEVDIKVRGVFRETGLPEEVVIHSAELRQFLEPHAMRVESAIKDHIQELPSDAASRSEERGLTLTGGTSLLKGWKERLEQRVGIPIHLCEDPLYSVIRGMKAIIDRPRDYAAIIKISETSL